MGKGDVVIPKNIEAPDRREFQALARKVRSQARKAGVLHYREGGPRVPSSGVRVVVDTNVLMSRMFFAGPPALHGARFGSSFRARPWSARPMG